MPVTITNLLPSGPLHVPLASGRTLRLSPGQTSAELPEVEVAGNARVDKLVARGVVEVTRADRRGARAPSEGPSPPAGSPRETSSGRSAAKSKRSSRRSSSTASPSVGGAPADPPPGTAVDVATGQETSRAVDQ